MGLFSIKEGLRIIGDIEAAVLTGDYNPGQGAGVTAKEGSLFLRKNGVTYKKTGPTATDWQPYSEIEHGGLIWYNIDTATTVEKDRGYVLDATSVFTVTMPSTPELGTRIGFATLGNAETNGITIDFNGANFNGAPDSLLADLNYAYIEFLYTGNATTGWVLSNSDESGNIANIRSFIGNETNADPGTPEYTENNVITAGDSLERAIDDLDIEAGDVRNYIGKSSTLDDMPTFSALAGSELDTGYAPVYIADEENLFISIARLDEELQATNALAVAGVEWGRTLQAITNDDPTGKTTDAFSDDSGGLENDNYWDETKWVVGDKVLSNNSNVLGHIFEWDGSTWVDNGALLNYHARAVKYDFLDTVVGQRDGAAYLMKESGPEVIKIADFDLSTAATIKMGSSYGAVSGDPDGDDSIHAAIEKLDGNNDAQDTLIGTAQGDVNLGNTEWNVLSDNITIKPALQKLDKTTFDHGEYTGRDATVEDSMPNFSGLAGNGMDTDYTPNYISDMDDLTLTSAKLDQSLKDLSDAVSLESTTTGVELETVIDSYPVSGNAGAKYFVIAWDGTGNRYASEIYVLNNDTNVDFTEYGILLIGSPGMIEMSVAVESGEVKLKAAPTSGTFTVKVQRNLLDI